MSDTPTPAEKSKGFLSDDTADKHSSTRLIAVVVALVGLVLIFIHGWTASSSLLAAGNAMLEFAKWLFLYIVGRSTIVGGARAIGASRANRANNPPPPVLPGG